jgi:hypothetical protein
MASPDARDHSQPQYQQPDLSSLKSFVDLEVLHDAHVKKSVEMGYMTAEELLIGRWISKFFDLNSSQTEESADVVVEEKFEVWKSKLPEASEAAAKEFGVTAEIAKELFEKSLNIRTNAMNS